MPNDDDLTTFLAALKKDGAIKRDLSERSFAGARLENILFSFGKLVGADLSGCTVFACGFQKTDLSGAKLSGTTFEQSVLRSAILRSAKVDDVQISSCPIQAADFTDASAPRLRIVGSVVVGSKFVRCDLTKAVLRDLNLGGCDFTDAKLAGADLSDSHLHDATFAGANVSGVDFSKSELYGADFSATALGNAKFDGAKYDTKTRWPGPPPAKAVFVENPDA